MNEIKIYLRPSGSLAYLYKDFDLYEGCYRNSQLTVFVPKSLLYENENGTFVNLVKTGAILTAPNGSKLTTKSYYLDYEREQTIGGVEFRVYTTITPKEFCVYAGTQTVVVNVESIDNTNADAQTIISVTTTQTADLIVLESAYLGQDEPIDPTELDKIKATLTEIQSEIGDLPNNYVTVDTNQTISGNKTHTGINTFNGFTSINGVGIDADAIVKGSDRFKYPVKSGTLALTSDIPENIVTKDENGQIKVPLAPAQDDDAVSKKYVDDADNTKLNKVEPFANGTYAYIVSKDDQFGTTNGYTEISETDKISTIVKRKTNGCIETRTPYVDIEAANKGYVDTAISDTQSQLAQTNQNVEDLYTILEQAQVVTVTTLEQAYTTRETADGENIVDGVQTTVKEIRGKTVATTNLIPYPYSDGMSKTTNGVTFTVSSDGSVTANGTATGAATFVLKVSITDVIDKNKDYYLSGCPAGGSTSTYYLRFDGTGVDTGTGTLINITDDTQRNCYLSISAGYTANNLIFRPMLNAGSEAKPYSKGFAGLKNASFEKIVSTGKNLIPYPYTETTKTANGVTFTDNGDGSITVNGTASAQTVFSIGNLNIQNNSSYFLSGCPSTGSTLTYILYVFDGVNGYADAGAGRLIKAASSELLVSIIIYAGATLNGVIFRPMLNIGASALPYEPYISDTLSAENPIELAEYDVAFPETGETKRQSYEKVFNGTEAWTIYTASAGSEEPGYTVFARNMVPNGGNGSIKSICNIYPYVRYGYTSPISGACQSFSSEGQTFFIKQQEYSTIDEWKAHLAELYSAGNPLTVTYQTAEATTEATPFNKSKYIAWKNGSETIDQGANDNSEYGAEDTVKQDYFTLTGGTTNV